MPRAAVHGGGDIALNRRPKIALVGFMGAGKTSVGRLIASKLGTELVDLDDVIVAAAGRSIAEIFRESGEVVFRARERAALRDVLGLDGALVFATGGGTFVDPQSRALLREAAHTVYLEASADALARRLLSVPSATSRPLLAGPDPGATIVRLLAERRSAYQECDLTVNTDGQTVQQVADEVIRCLGLRRGHTPKAVVSGALRAPASVSVAAAGDEGAGDSPPAGPLGPRTGVATAAFEGRREAAPVEPPSGGPTAVASVEGATRLVVPTSVGAYTVELRPDAGAWIAEAIAGVFSGARVAVVSDSNVAPLHATSLIAALRDLNVAVDLHTFEAGETSKSLETVAVLLDALLASGFGRNDGLVAVGGGVTGDITGFVASILLRGVGFVQVPTTTLAAVDSSVGGKTGVNTPRGKNLVGAFYPPRAVLVAAAHLKTQARREHAAGLVEALKMAACLDAQLFGDIVDKASKLLDFDPDVLLPVLSRAAALKADIVARDERESGVRAVLNYGHTVGHAIEAGEHYRLLHGEAVALGMAAENDWALAEGASTPAVRQDVEHALLALGAPTRWRAMRIDGDALALDKKRVGSRVRLPVVPALGTFEMRSVPVSALADFVRRRRAS